MATNNTNPYTPSQAASNANLQGADYFKNLALYGTPAEQSAARNWLNRHGFGTQTTTTPLIVTGSKPAQQFAKNSQYINQQIQNTQQYTPQPYQQGQEQKDMFKFMETYSDPYTQYLDKMMATSDKATQNLIATIKAQKANQMRGINDQYERLKQGLMSLGLSTGNINFTPELVYGSINQAENARLGKLQELDMNEATALLEAQQASDEKNFKLLKERIDYIKGIKKTRLELLKESYDTIAYEQKIGEMQARQIYDTIQGMDKNTQINFLQQIARQYNIPLASIILGLNEEKRARQGTTSNTKSMKSVDWNKIDDLLNNGGTYQGKTFNGIGEDDKVDPYLYLEIYNALPPAKRVEFVKKYPVVRFINKASYNLLPDTIKPKASRSTAI